MTMRCIVILAAILAVTYAQAESEPPNGVSRSLQQMLMAPVASEVAPLKPEAVSSKVTETQSRNKRAPILSKALLGGALLGAGALGAGALGAGALGAGALGAGILGVGLHKAKYLAGRYGGYGYGYGYPHYHNSDYHYHYHNYPQYHNYYPHYHHYSYGPGYGYW